MPRCALHDPATPALDSQIGAAGLVIVDRIEVDALGAAPGSWAARADRVQDAVAREHGGDPRYRQAQHQRERLAALLADGAIAGELIHALAADTDRSSLCRSPCDAG